MNDEYFKMVKMLNLQEPSIKDNVDNRIKQLKITENSKIHPSLISDFSYHYYEKGFNEGAASMLEAILTDIEKINPEKWELYFEKLLNIKNN